MIKDWLTDPWRWVLLVLFWATVGAFPAQAIHAADPVRLTVLNPRAEIKGPEPIPVSPRLHTLEGKRIGLINNSKAGADLLQPELEKNLKAVAPTARLKSYSISYLGFEGKDRALREAAQNSDGIILLLGD